MNDLKEIALTKLDVLDGLETIKIFTAYKVCDKTYDSYPADMDILNICEPQYEELPGWLEDTSQASDRKHLPENAKKYLQKLENKRKT